MTDNLTHNALLEAIRHGMAKAFFASAWADMMEESNRPVRGEIMDLMPKKMDPAANHAAGTLIMDMVNANRRSVVSMYLEYATEHGPEKFGHYCAMQSMGHGVGTEEVGCRDKFRVPYVEFGSHSLSEEQPDWPVTK